MHNFLKLIYNFEIQIKLIQFEFEFKNYILIQIEFEFEFENYILILENSAFRWFVLYNYGYLVRFS